jgi:hypothetical protein
MWNPQQQRWIRVEEEAVDRTLQGLDHALATTHEADERCWTERVGWALAELEEALNKHMAATAVPDGILAEEDLGGPMLSTLTRRMKKLRERVGVLVEQVRDLRRRLVAAVEAQANVIPDGSLPLDHVACKADLQALLLSLRKHREEEMDLLLEDITTDVGAGD